MASPDQESSCSLPWQLIKPAESAAGQLILCGVDARQAARSTGLRKPTPPCRRPPRHPAALHPSTSCRTASVRRCCPQPLPSHNIT
jgi:hypothetical protein